MSISIICSGLVWKKIIFGRSFKRVQLKKAYTTFKWDINNTEKAYDDLVLNTKTIDDVFNKDAYKEFNKNNKNIFEEAK